MSQKIEFVERAAKGEPIATLCREFGVSRTTGHKGESVRGARLRGIRGGQPGECQKTCVS